MVALGMMARMWRVVVTNTPKWAALTGGQGCGLPFGICSAPVYSCLLHIYVQQVFWPLQNMRTCVRVLYQHLLLPSPEKRLRTSVVGIDHTVHFTLESDSSSKGGENMFDSPCLIARTPRCVLDRSVLVYLKSLEVNVPVRLPDTPL